MSSRSPHKRFDRHTLRYLAELKANNERDWFEANKQRYEALVLEPALAFIERIGPKIERLSRHLVAVPKRTGGSLMRVYRDTRFSYDKRPYKTNIGIQFRHERGRDVHAPGLYVHIEPGACFLGAGLWRPEAQPLERVRRRIVEEPAAWRRASRNKRFAQQFALAGESLVRPPRGFAADAPELEDLKRKDFIAIAELRDSEVLAADFAEGAAAAFRAASPLMAFLCGALELPY